MCSGLSWKPTTKNDSLDLLSMNEWLIFALIVAAILILVILVILSWLIYERAKLKQALQSLTLFAQGNNNDLSGLCAAAITVDHRISAIDRRLEMVEDHVSDLVEKITELNQVEQTAHPYSGDIRKVRSGASIDELMKNSGLTHDEAALLVRLHGANPSSS